MHTIHSLPMTRTHLTRGRLYGPPRVLVLHATAGRYPGDREWLRKGGDPRDPISCHYLISPTGAIYQYVADHDTAWHAGVSSWEIDGVLRQNINPYSLGIELSGLNRPNSIYPQVQLEAALWLSRQKVQQYAIPRSQVVTHYQISPGRKTDPANFPLNQFLEQVYRPETLPEPQPPASEPYTADSPIIGTARGTAAQWIEALSRRSTMYDRRDITLIVNAYQTIGEATRVDWFLALAQMAHETGYLTSWWCNRPRRNAAGIGVTGAILNRPEDLPPPTGVWQWTGRHWAEGVAFSAWTPAEARGSVSSVEAHLGRLIAYALPPGHRWGEQVALADRALSVRGLPLRLHGSAPTLQGLDGIWAVPGFGYGGRLAEHANAVRRI